MVDRGMLERLYEVYGGSLTMHKNGKPEHHRPIWRWAITGRLAIPILEDALPELVLKAEQARLALEASRRTGTPGRGGGLTEQDRLLRQRHRRRILELNRRGNA